MRHDTTFCRAAAAGGQGSCGRPAIDPGLTPAVARPYVAGRRGAVSVARHVSRGA